MPALLANEPVPGPVNTAKVVAGLIGASCAQPGTCLLPVLTGGASAGLGCADEFRGSQGTA